MENISPLPGPKCGYSSAGGIEAFALTSPGDGVCLLNKHKHLSVACQYKTLVWRVVGSCNM